jgi:hypothetical protein
MELKKLPLVFFMLLLGVISWCPAFAQLGTTDVSSLTVQNTGTASVDVSIAFIDEAGNKLTYTQIPNLSATLTNPFSLAAGGSAEVYVPGIPAGLPSGRYSAVIESTGPVVANSNVFGSGAVYFNGAYSGFSSGADTVYYPAIVYNYFGWYSFLSVQNIGSTATDITVTITCADGTIGTLSKVAVPPEAAANFVLKNTLPTGFTSSTKCNGSAVVTASGGNQIVGVDNQSVPTKGNTQTYEAVNGGATPLYVPALYTGYFGWNSSLNVRKIGAGDTTVTVTYSDGTASTKNLTDANPGTLLYMPAEHPATGVFGATITSTALPVVATVNAANGNQAQTYNATATATNKVAVPGVMKSYFNWNTSLTCQNISATPTTLNVLYDGFAANAYDTASLSQGQTKEIFTPGESFLPAGHRGGATITANAAGANVSCVVNFNNPHQMASTTGDWSMSYNGPNI